MHPELDYGALIEVLALWQGLHRSFAASTPLLSWEPADTFVRAARELDDYALRHLGDALARSDAELFPLRDPLRVNLGEHRWLSTDREESYSDWLAWILQGISEAIEILPLFGLDDYPDAPLGPVEKVCREVPGEHGRTDVEVWFGDRGLLLIETKIQPTGDDLPLQLKRYEERAARLGAEPRLFVLLGTEDPNRDIGEFKFTDWRTLCIRLRGFAKRVKESDLLRSAAILMFCGAAEQNLLGMSSRPKPFHAMTTVDYLHEMEGRRMSDRASDKERDFLITGARTYLDADEAMALFRRRIQAEITTLVDNRLGEISRACGREWSANDVKDYTERQNDSYFIGKRLDVRKQSERAIYIYLQIRRESKALTYAAGVSLYRPNQSLWPDLWERIKEEPAETAGRTGNSVFFHRKLDSEKSVPDLVEPLALALDDFIAFMNKCGGIPKDAWPAP